MNKAQKEIYDIIKKTKLDWNLSTRKHFEPSWRKTLIDDQKGLISLLPDKIINDAIISPSLPIKNIARRLGAVSLLFWIAANLQDDLCDEENTSKEFIPLANICLRQAHIFYNEIAIEHGVPIEQFNHILLAVDQANLAELSSPKYIPKGKLAPANKSLFLLVGPQLLISVLAWSKSDQEIFLKAGQYFLSAKQLADDVYDFRDDWKKGRRNFAHQRLTQLPTKKELPLYFYKQAQQIKSLCLKSRRLLKTVSALKTGNCFDYFLSTLESNCNQALANLKLQEQVSYNRSKKNPESLPRATAAPVHNL